MRNKTYLANLMWFSSQELEHLSIALQFFGLNYQKKVDYEIYKTFKGDWMHLRETIFLKYITFVLHISQGHNQQIKSSNFENKVITPSKIWEILKRNLTNLHNINFWIMVNLALVSRGEGFYNLALRFYWINWKLFQSWNQKVSKI